jgi:hypothetical protein
MAKLAEIGSRTLAQWEDHCRLKKRGKDSIGWQSLLNEFEGISPYFQAGFLSHVTIPLKSWRPSLTIMTFWEIK